MAPRGKKKTGGYNLSRMANQHPTVSLVPLAHLLLVFRIISKVQAFSCHVDQLLAIILLQVLQGWLIDDVCEVQHLSRQLLCRPAGEISRQTQPSQPPIIPHGQHATFALKPKHMPP